MKKLLAIAILLASFVSVYAQNASQTTVEKVVSEVLAAMPAQNSTDFQGQMAALAAAAPASIEKVAAMMKPAGEGVRNNIYEYALSGVVSYVNNPATKKYADNVLKGLQNAAAATSDATNKAYLESLQRTLLPAPEVQEEEESLTAKAAKALLKSGDTKDMCEAAEALMKSNPAKALKMVSSALKNEDRQYRCSVLSDATELLGSDVLAPLLTKKYPKLSDIAKSDVLYWFGQNNVQSASGLVAKELANIAGGLVSSNELKNDAIQTAGLLGGKDFGKALVGLLGSSDGTASAAALKALKSFKGDIQDDVVSALATATNSDALMQLASARRMAKSAKPILDMFKSGNSGAAKYLAGVVGPGDVQDIASLLGSAKSNVPELQNALTSAIHTLSADDQYATVSGLAKNAAIPDNFNTVLARTGTDAAAADLENAYKNGSATALEGLLDIDNFKAASTLLGIAKGDASKVETVLPRFISLVQAYETDPDNQRRDYGEVLSLAKSKGLKTAALNALAAVPTMKSFLLAGKYLGDNDAAYAAANAVKNIASKTKEEINYFDMKDCLEKASSILGATGNADDGYAVNEINTMLEKLVPPTISQLTAEEKRQGFEMLFDGTNLDKWQGNKEGYIPVNGAILVTSDYGSTGNLYTLKEYRNFVYRFEFCFLRPGVNNGVGVRTPMGVDAAYDAMCEVQILDHDADEYKGWLRDYQVHGSVYGVVPAKRIVHKPIGEWSTEEIRVEGDRVKVTVNGQVILDANIRTACKGHNVAPDGSDKNPYTVDHRNHPGMFNKKGYVSFCGHGEGLKLRNVRILDLGNRK